MRWGRSFCLEAELKVEEDLIDEFIVLDEADNSHLASVFWIEHETELIDLEDHLRPDSRGHKVSSTTPGCAHHLLDAYSILQIQETLSLRHLCLRDESDFEISQGCSR